MKIKTVLVIIVIVGLLLGAYRWIDNRQRLRRAIDIERSLIEVLEFEKRIAEENRLNMLKSGQADGAWRALEEVHWCQKQIDRHAKALAADEIAYNHLWTSFSQLSQDPDPAL